MIAFYSAKDIPGLNSFTPTDDIMYSLDEEVFCSGDVKYYNQPLAVVVATSQSVANKAAKLVKTQYTNVFKLVIDVKEAKTDSKRNTLYKEKKQRIGDWCRQSYNMNYTIQGQQHFSMENLFCVT